MEIEKYQFLKEGMFHCLEPLTKKDEGIWGVMKPQEMVEHLADFFDVSSAKIHFDLAIPKEHLPRYKEFLYSDKPFRENTKAPTGVLGEKPMPLRIADLEAAKKKLERSVQDFFNYFNEHTGAQTLHPVFGMLTVQEWVLLHYKHVTHHLRQFKLWPATGYNE